MEDWQGIDGVAFDGAGDEGGDPHARAQGEEEDEQEGKHEKVELRKAHEKLLLAKGLPEFMRKDGEGGRRVRRRRSSASTRGQLRSGLVRPDDRDIKPEHAWLVQAL